MDSASTLVLGGHVAERRRNYGGDVGSSFVRFGASRVCRYAQLASNRER